MSESKLTIADLDGCFNGLIPAVIATVSAQRVPNVTLPGIMADLVGGHRRLAGEQRGLNRADELVHHAARTMMSANGSLCSISSLPCRANSSAARKLLASADLR